MKDFYNISYKGIYTALNANYDSIQCLYKQAEELNKLLHTIADKDPEYKDQINSTLSSVNQSINDLMDSTAKLFDLYNEQLLKAIN